MATNTSNQLDLLVDTDSGRLVRSFTSTKAANPPRFTFGDVIPVTIRLLKKTSEENSGDNPYTEMTLTNLAARLAVGEPSGNPTGGTFKLDFSGNATANISYDASASNVEDSLNRVIDIQNAGNVTVLKPATGLYRVVFNAVGSRAAMTADASVLSPTSTITISEATTGDASTRETQLVHLETSNAAYSEFTTALPSAAITIANVRHGETASSTSEIQTIDLSSPEPYGGTWTATTNVGTTNTSAPIAWNASAATVQAALIATNSTGFTSKITCSGAFPLYTVEFDSTLGNCGTTTASATSLKVPTGFKGDFSCTGAKFRELLGGATSKVATMEVEIRNTDASTSWTPLQTKVTVRDDVI